MDYGLIGKVLGHSFSAEIHPKLFDCRYDKCELKENELDRFFKNRDFKGINVTVPYKETVIKYLDEIDENAERIGAVNTVINQNGKLKGFNTDYSGLKTLITSSGTEIKGSEVLVLGTGGTSKTAKAVLNDLGAKDIKIISRTKTGGEFDNYDNIAKYYDFAEVIVNTTPVGMYPNIDQSAVSLDGFNRLKAVFDVIYNPIRSKLVCDAEKKGLIALGGTLMLVFQAVAAARLFSGIGILDSEGNRIFNEILKAKENIVLIGMPSSGKSTVGRLLAEYTGKEFFDTDMLAEEKYGFSPKDLINNYGEEKFRECESEIIKELSAKQGLIIATGGGAVEREKNIDFLKQNGKIVFLNRDFKYLCADNSRPLSSTKEKLKALYIRRLPVYKAAADITVSGEATPQKTAEKILEMI